jgi:hypothetical protein
VFLSAVVIGINNLFFWDFYWSTAIPSRISPIDIEKMIIDLQLIRKSRLSTPSQSTLQPTQVSKAPKACPGIPEHTLLLYIPPRYHSSIHGITPFVSEGPERPPKKRACYLTHPSYPFPFLIGKGLVGNSRASGSTAGSPGNYTHMSS